MLLPFFAVDHMQYFSHYCQKKAASSAMSEVAILLKIEKKNNKKPYDLWYSWKNMFL